MYSMVSIFAQLYTQLHPLCICRNVLKTTLESLQIPVSERVVKNISRILNLDWEALPEHAGNDQPTVLHDDLSLSDEDDDECPTTSSSSSDSDDDDDDDEDVHDSDSDSGVSPMTQTNVNELEVRGQKRPHEEQCSLTDYGSDWSVRKLVCQVAPPGSHGSYDNANRVRSDETWDSLIESLTFTADRTPQAFEQEVLIMQKLFTILNERLPVNAIDRIIYLLGGKYEVSELSGRTDGVEYVLEEDNEGNKRLSQKPYSRGKTSQTNINGTTTTFQHDPINFFF